MLNLKTIWTTGKNIVTGFMGDKEVRTGSKISMCWLIFSGILILWLLVGVVILSVFYTPLTQIFPHLASIVTALIGGGAVVFTTSETRKTIENVRNVRRNEEESPQNPRIHD